MKRADPDLPKRFTLLVNHNDLLKVCARCPFTLVCLSGKQFKDVYLCGECQAIWISEAKTLVNCDAFMMAEELDMIAGCEACEPFEIAPEDIVRIEGYQAEVQGEVHAPDEE